MDNYKFTFDEIQPGMILESTWGYSMIIVNFYKVIGKRGKSTVDLQKMTNKITEGNGMQGMAIPGEETDKIFSARINKRGYLKLSRFGHKNLLSRWDGTPIMFDHMD